MNRKLLVSGIVLTLINTYFVTQGAGREWKNPYNIGFEIRNHDPRPITITLKYDDVTPINLGTADPLFMLDAYNSVIWQTTINGKTGPNYPTLATPIDIKISTVLTVTYTDKKGQKAFKRFQFPADKTIFVAWENNTLRPQKGSFGNTQSGLSLKNNVRQSDIRNLQQGTIGVVKNQNLVEEDERFGEL